MINEKLSEQPHFFLSISVLYSLYPWWNRFLANGQRPNKDPVKRL